MLHGMFIILRINCLAILIPSVEFFKNIFAMSNKFVSITVTNIQRKVILLNTILSLKYISLIIKYYDY